MDAVPYSEFEAFRKGFNEFAADALERQVRIETLVELLHADLNGNGQPGRCDQHSKRLASLERDRAWLYGVVAGIGAVIALVGNRVIHLLEKLAR